MNNSYNEDEISLLDLMQVLIKRKMLIAKIFSLITALALLFAFLPIFERDKEYEAISSISIIYNYKTPANPEQIGEGYVFYQDRMQNIMIPTIKGYAQSLTLLRNVISDLGLVDDEGEPIRAVKLAEDIAIENQENSNVIRISVKYNDEENAAAIANLIPNKLVQMSNANLELRDYNILIIDEARANETQTSAGKLLTVAIGMVLGLMLGVFAAFAREYMNKKVGSFRDVTSLGMEGEIEKKGPVTKDIIENILMLSSLAQAKTIVIAAEEHSASRTAEMLSTLLNDASYKTKINNYTENAISSSKSVTVENKVDKNDSSTLDLMAKKNAKIPSLEELEISVISLYDERFPLLSKQSDKAFLIVEQETTDKNTLKTLSQIAGKYNLNVSVVYLT